MNSILKDKYGRVFKYLRLSITDLCNFNCKYCLPISNSSSYKKRYLTVNEIYNLVAVFSELGINKVRVTGGEPTVRKDFVEIGKVISSIKGIDFLSFTSNGYRLSSIINDVYAVGFNGVNISLDTLNLDKFAIITGRNYYKEVLDGIYKSLDIGLITKINVVLSNFFSFEDFCEFYILAKYKKVTIRFIEQMGTFDIKNDFSSHLTSSYIKEFLLNNNWNITLKSNLSGPALEFYNTGFCGKIGVINPYSNLFCFDCNRLRVSAEGILHLCLLSNKNLSLIDMLASSSMKNNLKKFIMDNLINKDEKHFLKVGKVGSFCNFSSIGG